MLVVAHGADSGWNRRVREVVEAVRWPGPVAVTFLMGGEGGAGSWNDATTLLERAGAERIVAVPFMVSSHGAHVWQIRHYADSTVALPAALASHHHGEVRRAAVPMVVTGALDDAPELGEVLADRWAELGSARRERPIVLVAHGPESDADAARWVAGLRSAMAPLAKRIGEERLRIGLLRDDAPPAVRDSSVGAIRDTIRAMAARGGDSVLVLTVLVSSGRIDRVKIPADLAGLPVDYVGTALSPHPAMARWIERVAREATAMTP